MNAKGLLLAVIVVGLGIAGFLGVSSFVNRNNEDVNSEVVVTDAVVRKDPFSDVNTSNLSSFQRNLLSVLKEEYAKSPVSYDDTVLTYTEGHEESWCTDFISWAMLQAGSPNISEETGYWRIPGVLSLQAYYINGGAYKTLDEDYSPRLGDIAFYIGDQTPDGGSGEHAAIVLSYNGKTLVTIGGNEGDDGVLRIRSESVTVNETKGLVGYGVSS